jgi:pyruvate dehydrogenase E1 component alpha subunit
VCENNLYSVYTPLEARQPDRPITELARGHAIHSVHVDGNDVMDVHRVATGLVARARSGHGPSFLLADTYRWREHCGPNYDNTLGYRTVAEFESWKSRDPLGNLAARLESAGLLDAATRREIEREFAAEIAAAFEFAENAPFPATDSAALHLYAG